MKKAILSILTATIWIVFSEFVRNELLLKTYWTEHYQRLGLQWPDDPVHGAIWGIWALGFAILIYILSTRFSLMQNTFLSWFAGFVLMWVVTGNMGVLPFGILVFAIPWTLFEVFIAAWIMVKFRNGNRKV